MSDNVIPGYCPMGCGETLFRASGGYITCSWIGCPRPDAASDILHDQETDHTVEFREDSFTLRHPLRERLDDELTACGLHAYIASQDGPPPQLGTYRVTRTGSDGSSLLWTKSPNLSGVAS
jgi:hypothetical protein